MASCQAPAAAAEGLGGGGSEPSGSSKGVHDELRMGLATTMLMLPFCYTQ